MTDTENTAAATTSYPPNQTMLEAMFDFDFNGGTDMPEGLPFKDYVAKHFDLIEKAIAKIPTTQNTVTLTDAQVTQLADQIAAKLPAAATKADVETAVHDTIKGQWDK